MNTRQKQRHKEKLLKALEGLTVNDMFYDDDPNSSNHVEIDLSDTEREKLRRDVAAIYERYEEDMRKIKEEWDREHAYS